MPSALDRVMDQAADAAANAPSANANLVPTGNTGGQVQTYTRPTLDSIADSAGMAVDGYLTLKYEGMRIDKNELFKKARVRIDFSKVTPILSVRATRGGNTTFIKSYDGGQTTSQGQSFQQQLDYLRNVSDKVDGPYATVEIPAELLENVPGGKKGFKIGITPPITGVKYFSTFYDELRNAGLQKAVVEVDLVHKGETNRNNNEWGVVTFENFAEAA